MNQRKKSCVECGAENPVGPTECRECGAPLLDRCEHCNYPYEPERILCGNCGKPVLAEETIRRNRGDWYFITDGLEGIGWLLVNLGASKVAAFVLVCFVAVLGAIAVLGPAFAVAWYLTENILFMFLLGWLISIPGWLIAGLLLTPFCRYRERIVPSAKRYRQMESIYHSRGRRGWCLGCLVVLVGLAVILVVMFATNPTLEDHRDALKEEHGLAVHLVPIEYDDLLFFSETTLKDNDRIVLSRGVLGRVYVTKEEPE